MALWIKEALSAVDSPLAAEATRVYSGDLHGYLDEEAIAVLQGGDDLFTFPGLTLVQSTDESKALNMDKSSKVIMFPFSKSIHNVSSSKSTNLSLPTIFRV